MTLEILLTSLAAFGALLFTAYKMAVYIKHPKISEIVDQRLDKKLETINKTLTHLIEKNSALELRVMELSGESETTKKNVIRMEKDHRDFAQNIYKKIDDMGAEIIQIIRDTTNH